MIPINDNETNALFCDLEAIPLESRKTHQVTAQQLVTESSLEMKELSDGYAFKFPANLYETITQYIANERLCCPFLTLELIVSANQEPLWLHIRGSEEIKAFLAAQF